jgi:hypothetical protein
MYNAVRTDLNAFFGMYMYREREREREREKERERRERDERLMHDDPGDERITVRADQTSKVSR